MVHVAHATAPGFTHTNPGQPGKVNNQDAVVIRRVGDSVIGVVCDGCGSQPHSEVGSDIGAQLIANHLERLVSNNTSIDWGAVTAAIVDQIKEVTCILAGSTDTKGPAFQKVLIERFLFTSLVIVVHNNEVRIATFGDGAYIIDDEHWTVNPPLENAPPYLGYLLLADTAYHKTPELRDWLRFDELVCRPLDTVEKSIIIGTDGIEPISDQDFHHPALMQPKQLQRLINVLATERLENGRFVAGKCRDDVSMIIVRSDAAQERLVEGKREVVLMKRRIDTLEAQIKQAQAAKVATDKEKEDLVAYVALLEEEAAKLKPQAEYGVKVHARLQDLRQKVDEMQQRQTSAKAKKRRASSFDPFKLIDTFLDSMFGSTKEQTRPPQTPARAKIKVRIKPKHDPKQNVDVTNKGVQ